MENHNFLLLIAMSLFLALLPIMATLTTAYLKVSIVIGMLKNSLGITGLPGGAVVLAISLGVSAVVMAPVVAEVSLKANQLNPGVGTFASFESIKEQAVALSEPLKGFLKQQAGNREQTFVIRISSSAKLEKPGKDYRLNFAEVLLAYVLTELREGFSMGFQILLPFLVVDMVVANLLIGMGMFMVSPVMISLPIKVLMFVLADGWMLLVQALVSSYQV